MDTETTLDSILSQFSHELKNDFISIRATAGSIKKNVASPDIIEKKVALINQILDQAIMRVDATRTLLLKMEAHKSSVN